MNKIWMYPLSLLSKLFSVFFGQLNWTSPPWIQHVNASRHEKPRTFWSVVILLVFSVFVGLKGYQYFQSLPKDITLIAQIRPLKLTENIEKASPDNLTISFSYDLSKVQNTPTNLTYPRGAASPARLDLIGQTLKQGIVLSPFKKGQWRWDDDNLLTFTPETDWPAGVKYKVSFDNSIFVNEAKLSENSYEFTTPKFITSIESLSLYQDPTDINVRRVIATLKFSHPVDKKLLEAHLHLGMRPSNAMKNVSPKTYPFSLSYDKNLREAYLQTAAITLPNEPNYMKLEIGVGIKSIFGGEANEQNVDKRLLIPDLYSFLKVSEAQTQIVNNVNNEPEQMLMLTFTDDIDQKELLSKLALYLLPAKNEKLGRDNWSSPRDVDDKVLNTSKKIALKMVENERSSSTSFSFVIDVPENRNIYLHIAAGFSSVNKFVHASFYDQVLRSPVYPKEVDIAGEGSLMTYSGDHQISILSRGITTLKYAIGRVQENQLNHLVTQTSGDINNPRFNNWSFNAKNMAYYSDTLVDVFSEHPKKSQYSSLNLNDFFPTNDKKLGLFFVNVKAWDKERNIALYGIEDQRLILVTDLGLVVKNNADQSHDVFVQSIKTGLPVVGASVSLLGKNGLALYTQSTSAKGHVLVPITTDFKDEQEPSVYLVKYQGDVSFIPFNRYERQLNLSKFDIGGIRHYQGTHQSLNAFLFSDRGIYRPGEKVNIGAIVKNFDMSNVEDIPLEVVVYGPRGNEVKVSKITLAKMGFFDFSYQTEATSDTGRYRASVHLIRDNRYRGQELGSVNFTVEEFQPDSMKIASTLVDVNDEGWTDQRQMNIEVTLQNLFGLPAQNRNVTGQVIIEPVVFSFKKYQDYQFSDQTSGQSSDSSSSHRHNNNALSINKKLAMQATDADGKAHFTVNLEQFNQGAYRLQFISEGFEQGGGRSVTAKNSALISPLAELVGYKTDGDLSYIHANSKRSVAFIAIDKTLKQIKKSQLTFTILHIQQLSTLVKQKNGVYQYQTIKKESISSSTDFELNVSGYLHTIDTTEPGDYAIEISDEQGRKLSRVNYSVVGQGNSVGKLDKNAELKLSLNKSDYLPGETIEMNIQAPYAGAGLISIETDKVHRFKWFKTATQSSMQFINIPEDLEGTAYVNVSFVRDVTSKEIFTSPLSYAVKPFSIDKSKRNIEVQLTVDDIVRPGAKMAINYQASKPSKIAIFAVDEGILQVANYSTPDPLNHFLKKKALAVDTLQILDLILPEFALLKSVSASGGGSMARKALAKNINPFARNVDKPAVFWSGIYDADTVVKSVNFDIPNTFAGSLRIMAVAVAEDSVGTGQTSTLVRGPFVISPRVLTQAAPGDEFVVTLGVANIIKDSGENAQIKIKTTTSEGLTLIGETSAQLNIDEGSEGLVSFRVKANQHLGAAELTFTVSHKNEKASRTASVSIRPATPFYATFTSGFEQSNHLELDITRQLYPNLASQTLAASASPLVLVDGLSAYLSHYPHGCTEQVVSKVFPLVGLMNHPAYAPHVKEVNSHFSHVIDKLRERQRGDGGFSFWPKGTNTAEYPSIYVMHFLIEAQSLGYAVPSDMLQRGKDYLSEYVGHSSNSILQARVRANAIYLLSRLGVVTTNYLVDLEDYLDKNYKDQWRTDLLSAYMASTYKLLHKDQEAQQLISGYQMGAASHFDDFHSSLSQDAQYVFLLAKHFATQAKKLDGQQLLTLTSSIFKGQYNTISAAYSILALGAYSKLVLSNSPEKISFTRLDKDHKATLLSALTQPFLTASYPHNTEKVTMSAEQSLYYLNIQSGFDLQSSREVVRQGLEITRDFLDGDGKVVTTFVQGQDVTIRLRVRALNNQIIHHVAVIDLLPGGFEVIRSSVQRTAYNWRADYVDVREDRVVYYGDFDSRVRELTYQAKLTATGTFIIPPSYAESMYDRSIKAMSAMGSFIVTPVEQHLLSTTNEK